MEEPETHIKRQATRHDCLPRLDEPNEPTKQEKLSLVLICLSFNSQQVPPLSLVSLGVASLKVWRRMPIQKS
jgi:hypothetical protein